MIDSWRLQHDIQEKPQQTGLFLLLTVGRSREKAEDALQVDRELDEHEFRQTLDQVERIRYQIINPVYP